MSKLLLLRILLIIQVHFCLLFTKILRSAPLKAPWNESLERTKLQCPEIQFADENLIASGCLKPKTTFCFQPQLASLCATSSRGRSASCHRPLPQQEPILPQEADPELHFHPQPEDNPQLGSSGTPPASRNAAGDGGSKSSTDSPSVGSVGDTGETTNTSNLFHGNVQDLLIYWICLADVGLNLCFCLQVLLCGDCFKVYFLWAAIHGTVSCNQRPTGLCSNESNEMLLIELLGTFGQGQACCLPQSLC